MSLRAVACRLGSGLIVVGVVAAAAALATLSPGTRRAALADACPASGPPCPANAYITLSVSAGGPNTTIGVSGGQFLPGQSMALYWDTSNQVIGSATANGQGSWGWVNVKPFAGQQPGLHRICASVTPQPCAQFELQGTPTPTPAIPTPSPQESPSPPESPSPSESPTPIPIPAASQTGGLDLILKPPLVFLPLAGLAGLIAAVAWWLFAVFPRQQRTLPAAAVIHRSTRPTWGGDPAAPADPSRPAWPTVPSPTPQVEPEQASGPDFPEGTDDRPHWAPPRPSIPDDDEET